MEAIQAAAALVRDYGPTRALSTANHLAATQPEYADVARLLERGIVSARQAQASAAADDPLELAQAVVRTGKELKALQAQLALLRAEYDTAVVALNEHRMLEAA